MSLKRVTTGDSDKIIAVIREISERKRMERQLKKSEERFKALHNPSFGGITLHDKGVILECNQGLAEITGHSVEELIGMDGLLLIAPRSRDLVLDKIVTGYEKAYEAMGIRKNGEEYPLRLEAPTVPYKGKNVRSVEFHDIKSSSEQLHYLKSYPFKSVIRSSLSSKDPLQGGKQRLIDLPQIGIPPLTKAVKGH